MKFLLDVHIGASIGRALIGQGYDVLRAGDAHATWQDADLLGLAVAQGRVLVTEDRDFSDLIYRDAALPPPAIIYLRCSAADQAKIAERLLLVLANTVIDNHMVVMQRTSVRHRPLPGKQTDNG